MLQPQVFTQTQIDEIIKVLTQVVPECTFTLCNEDKRFIRVTKSLGTQRVDTIPITLERTELIHLFEAREIMFQLFDSLVSSII
jgi:hypothetical protein